MNDQTQTPSTTPDSAASALSAGLERLAELAKRSHTYCEDGWYSCPKAEDGCLDDSRGPECDCGADEHNAEVDALMALLRSNDGFDLMTETRMRGYAAIGLHHPKTAINVGSALRAAQCYGGALVAYTGQRYRPAATDTMKAYRHLPLIGVDDLFSIIPHDCVPVAVDLLEGARDLTSYTHPERAFYIFGPEDGTLGRTITDRCRDKIFVPTTGCMNLAACVNVVLYDRLAKGRKS